MLASESWTVRITELELLEVWERKILCNIFGGVNVDGRRVRKNNQELRELYGEHSITNRLRARKLEWLGHILRLPNERFLKKLTVSHIGGRKRRGRPRVRERERDGKCRWRTT